MNLVKPIRPVGPSVSISGLGFSPTVRQQLSTLAGAVKPITGLPSATPVLLTGSQTDTDAAAAAVAAEAGRQLLRVDLNGVVSKYIGETDKNLEHVFESAEAEGAILLFDEADALFGHRSEVQDSHGRYGNLEIGYLLQRLEAFSGLVIFATQSPVEPPRKGLFRYVVTLPPK